MAEANEWDAVVHAMALAARLEGEGQYNNAKLLRAAAESILRRAAYGQSVSSDLAAESEIALRNLQPADESGELGDALQKAHTALAEGRLPMFGETPTAYICRTCGYALTHPPEDRCPTCTAQPRTFMRFLPVYWLTELNPFEALEMLHRTPERLRAILERLGEETLNKAPEDGGWSIRQVVSHYRDAEGVLNARVKLMLEEDDPSLKSLAVFDWAADEKDRPPTGMEIYAGYRDLRQETVSTLEAISLEDWWRTGRHEEFGPVTVGMQASYFAVHELTHFPQLEALLPEG